MTAAREPSSEARADRRVVLIAVAVMLGLVLFGVGFGSLFAATSCRQVRPIIATEVDAAATGDAARALLGAAVPGADAVTSLEDAFGPLRSAVDLPLDAPLRIGPAPTGIGAVVVTGDGAVLVSTAGDVTSDARFRRPVTVVGDGVVLFALVVGNTLTGQVDAIRPLVPTADGLEPGTCVDTSAVGSPLSFLHDARDGNLVGLRTDEDGSEAVLELRDHVRGRVWAPVVELPRAPAGLQGSRTSGAIGDDTVVTSRRIVLDADEPMPAVRAFRRSDGLPRWEVDAATLRAALPGPLAGVTSLRIEVAHVGSDHVTLLVFPDVAPDALLPLPTFGPLGELAVPHPQSVTVLLDVVDGAVGEVRTGPPAIGRDGAARDELRVRAAATGVTVDDALSASGATWLLIDGVLARFGD